MFDITKIAATDKSTVDLVNGNDEPLFGDDGKTQLSITVFGPGSTAYQDAQTETQNRSIDLLKKKGKVVQTAKIKAAQAADFLAAVTVSFNGFGHPDHPEGGERMFKAVYADPTLGFIAEQVQRHVSDWSHFTKG